MSAKYLAGIAVLLLGCATPALADDTCHLQLVTSLAMGIDRDGGVYVPMTVAGKQVNLLIDTGGIDSMLDRSTVDMLGLRKDAMGGGIHMTMFGGARIDSYATAHDIILGTLKAPEMRFLIMPDGHTAPEVQGTLAPDVLRAYDDDFDFAGAKFNLISQDHCPGKVVYWTKDPPAEIQFYYTNITHVSFPVLLDGKQVTVEMDTGASRSVYSLEDAQSLFGFDAASPALVSLNDYAPGRSFKYPFKTMTFGGVSVANPDIVLVPDAVSRLSVNHIILGMGILRQLHLYIAYHEKKLYVTPASAH